MPCSTRLIWLIVDLARWERQRMRLSKARVMKYRSVQDSGLFDVEEFKTILVGPNEAGKTAVLEALQQVNPPPGVRQFDPLRDYPRSEYNDISTGKVKPSEVTVVEAYFTLEDADKAAIEEEFRVATYVRARKLDNPSYHRLEGILPRTTYGSIKKDLTRLAAHVDARMPKQVEGQPAPQVPSAQLTVLAQGWLDTAEIAGDHAAKLTAWLQKVLPLADDKNAEEEGRHDRLTKAVGYNERRSATVKALEARMPVFVLFSNYFRVKPLIHLEHLAQRLESNILDDEYFDYGNKCLLQL